MIQRWYPNCDPRSDDFREIAVWIRVPRLPIALQ